MSLEVQPRGWSTLACALLSLRAFALTHGLSCKPSSKLQPETPTMPEVLLRCQARRQNQALSGLGVPKTVPYLSRLHEVQTTRGKKARICGLSKEPSDGLEPSTP